MTTRFASQWDSYLEYYTSYLAPMGVEIFFKVFVRQTQFDKTLKKIVADSGTDSFMECKISASKN
jgi:hypothetical protein